MSESTAVFVKTESSDNYLYSISREMTIEEVIAHLKEDMGDEFDCISEAMIETNGYPNLSVLPIYDAME